MKIEQHVLEILDRSTRAGNALRLPDEQLDRKVYMAVNKIIEIAGGKWNRSAKAHLFAGSAEAALDPIILTGEVTNNKQELGQFDTPPELAYRLVEMAEIKPGMKVYEPSAGIGNIVAWIIGALGSGAGVFANELDPKRHAECLTRHYQAFGSGGLSQKDFLSIEPGPLFDRIVMNPPFARQADIDHVTHALKFLDKGGILVSVMSAAVTFRSDKKATYFREMVAAMGGEITTLPPDSFKSSGTGVNAVIVKLKKKE